VKRLLIAALVVLAGVTMIAGVNWYVTSVGLPGADGPARSTPAPHTSTSSAVTDAAMPGIPDDAFELTVESVHDGDTLRARIAVPNEVITDTASTRIRLIGVDTPEISPDLECWGDEATQSLTALVPPGSTVWASADLDVLDPYERHLLYLWTPDGRFVNGELISAGDATVMIFAPNDRYEPLLRQLETEASASGVGLWGACG
jgi:micrococcal nuclease